MKKSPLSLGLLLVGILGIGTLLGYRWLAEPSWAADAAPRSLQTTTPSPENSMNEKDTHLWQKRAESFTKPDEAELRSQLTPLQYQVTQNDATEAAFRNEFWDNKKEGLYVDIVSGEPLFSSNSKYKSGTGWPSFTRALHENAMTYHEDRKLFSTRTELRSSIADSHIGHVFDDGPQPTGKRYCVNSAALRFIPKERLAEEGYPEYSAILEEETRLEEKNSP